ncbi:hypothetical protein BD410DRAFT_621259 [Rickenella mellea]|uniref:Uncharacterized protein n=1 Tax=Rickenella mellea TaxID=50990 RepID=A0A4Y7PM62_9AGAM|nr:hypothetical protein BD410DRAFT_621259 [Rickenella mellea]
MLVSETEMIITGIVFISRSSFMVWFSFWHMIMMILRERKALVHVTPARDVKVYGIPRSYSEHSCHNRYGLRIQKDGANRKASSMVTRTFEVGWSEMHLPSRC